MLKVTITRNSKGEEIRTTRENITQLSAKFGKMWDAYTNEVQELRRTMYNDLDNAGDDKTPTSRQKKCKHQQRGSGADRKNCHAPNGSSRCYYASGVRPTAVPPDPPSQPPSPTKTQDLESVEPYSPSGPLPRGESGPSSGSMSPFTLGPSAFQAARILGTEIPGLSRAACKNSNWA